MKKLLLLAVLTGTFLMMSCRDDDPASPDSLYLYTTSGTVEAAAGTHSVTISTTCAWEAKSDEWIAIDPSGGEKGIIAVHFDFGANDSGAPRTGRVVFRAGTYSETYSLTQKAQ